MRKPLLLMVASGIAFFAAQPVFAIQTYGWNQGSSPRPMMRLNEGVCWLAGVQGKFIGGAEIVRVSVRNNQWFLGGNSNQEGVAGEAKCASWAELAGFPGTVKGPYTWRNGNRAVAMEGNLCFLSAVSGNLRGGGESVAIRRSGSSWVLTGASQQDFVYGEAYCVNSRYIGQQSLSWSPGLPPTPLASPCFLHLIAGSFNGGAERVGIWGNGYGRLTGRYYSDDGVWAETICIAVQR